jgi:alkylation response protein AidB-like acyl-CoA dehydrogenase
MGTIEAPTTDWAAVVQELGPRFAARAAAHDAHDSFVADSYAELRERRVFSAGVPAELGGGGASHRDLCGMLRTLAHSCSSTALALAMHTHPLATAVWRWRHEGAPVEGFLRRVAAEELVLATSGGSDFLAGSGTAVRVEGGYRITGRKVFGSGSPGAQIFMTMAIHDDPTDGPTVLHVAVPLDAPGVTVADNWRTLGMRGTGSHDVVIDGHVVPDAAVGARRKAGEWHPLFQIIATIAFPLVYSVYLGVAESARDIAVGLAKKRRPDRNVLSLVGQMETALRAAQMARQSMLDVVRRDAPSAETINDVMIGRQLVGQNVLRVAELAMEAAGGAGFYRAQKLEKHFRDIQGARYHPLQSGPQAEYAGAMALGLPVDTIF